MVRTAFTLVLALGLFMPPAQAADLTVHVLGVRNADGDVRLTLFKGPDFLKFDRVLRSTKSAAKPGTVSLHLCDLPPGNYAFSLAHDENRNGTADMNFMNIPTEGVAVSNDARGFLGPPSAEAATFSVAGQATEQTVTLVYY